MILSSYITVLNFMEIYFFILWLGLQFHSKKLSVYHVSVTDWELKKKNNNEIKKINK